MLNILQPSRYDKWLETARRCDVYVNGRFAFPVLSTRDVDEVRNWTYSIYPGVSEITVVEE